jgi:hypothetical protein
LTPSVAPAACAVDAGAAAGGSEASSLLHEARPRTRDMEVMARSDRCARRRVMDLDTRVGARDVSPATKNYNVE